jgi:hypothetical protein
MAIGTGVKEQHPDYKHYSNLWRRVRDVISGQDAIHQGGPQYLPILVDQPMTAYNAYVARTPFYNASFRTVSGFNGMLFRKPPALEVEDSLEELLDDVTMSGVPFEVFAENVCYEQLTVSKCGILVDYPRPLQNEDGSTVTVAQAQAANMRPTMQLYKTENIINWRYEFLANKNTLVQVRLLEHAEIIKSEFESIMEARIRVLDLFEGKYRQRIFKQESEEQIGADIFPLMNNKPLTEIPFYIITPSGIDGRTEEPIFIDLFDLNIKHYQVSASYENGCHMTGLPTPWVTGYTNEMDETGKVKPADFYIGSNVAWVFTDPNTKVGFLEFHGTGLKALETNLDRKEAQMAAIGARMLAPEKKGVEASETLTMRHNGENSILSAIANSVSMALVMALKTFAEWAGKASDNISFEINREFLPIAVDGRTLVGWVQIVQNGLLSKESMFDLFKRAEMVDEDLTYEEEQARIDSQPPPMPAMLKMPGAPPAPGAPPKPPVKPEPEGQGA